MKLEQLINNIKKYSIVSCILPFFTINLCLFIFQILGNYEVYKLHDWEDPGLQKAYSVEKFLSIEKENEGRNGYSFTSCPEKNYDFSFVTSDGKILWNNKESIDSLKELKVKNIVLKYNDEINKNCIKNSTFSYFFLKIFKPIEGVLIDVKFKSKSGFGKIKSPYLYGEASISRTARYFPGNLIFKPLIVLSAFFLFLYWRNNLNLFKEFKNNNLIKNFSSSFYYFGILSCIFLFFHAIFLGLDFDSKIFLKIRRVIIILFIVCEVCAQFYLAKNLFLFKENLKNFINIFILKLKILFVILILLSTVVILGFLIWGNLDGSVKHILEWNYFSVLLLYYLLSRLLWKLQKP